MCAVSCMYYKRYIGACERKGLSGRVDRAATTLSWRAERRLTARFDDGYIYVYNIHLRWRYFQRLTGCGRVRRRNFSLGGSI